MSNLPSAACACGCNEMPKSGNTFVNGHDGRLVSMLKKAYESGRSVRIYGVTWSPDNYALRISSRFNRQYRRATGR